ncbi:MAG TPA: hypothetical protein PL048_26225 [Leptospiraceae bacterium]|nr:hypothetical protein [Leptospiraceae bacterium]HMZ62296.1 hypothetical protein [Leptospiraceae bacterium]HNF12382.1 hypothetical protein [Leptospiraceae bacterium]HNF26767.1 hypothetical protein [Leptospiraceae bacterium]HNI94808.1 hypothetical protein [Leptospiraceae bacterium]
MHIIFIFILFTENFLYALPSAPEGLGVIGEKSVRFEGVFFPTADLELYKISDRGKMIRTGYQIGFAEEEQKDFAHIKKGELCIKNTSKGKRAVHFQDFAELEYEGKYLIFWEFRNEYIKILMKTDSANIGNSPNHPEIGFYIKISDLQKAEFDAVPWIRVLNQKDKFFNSAKEGLNLREEANVRSRRIIKITDEKYVIIPLKKTNGKWMEVRVQKRKRKYCEDGYDIIEHEYRGWIKAMDDSGRPNVWFYPRGC